MQATKTTGPTSVTKMTFPRCKYSPHYGAEPCVTALKSRWIRLFETLTGATGRTMSRKSMNEIRFFQFRRKDYFVICKFRAFVRSLYPALAFLPK